MTNSSLKICLLVMLSGIGLTPYSYAQDTPNTHAAESADSTETLPVPLVRYPPMMPARAKNSGYCCIDMDISPNGSPKNVTAPFCTEEIFKQPSIDSVKRWKYAPATKNGKATTFKLKNNLMTFILHDEAGNFLSDPEELLIEMKRRQTEAMKNNVKITEEMQIALARDFCSPAAIT